MPLSIRETLSRARESRARYLWGRTASVCLTDFESQTSLRGRRASLENRSVLIAVEDTLAAALALIELDGVAGRVVVSTPDLDRTHLPYVISTAAVDAVVVDDSDTRIEFAGLDRVCGGVSWTPDASQPTAPRATEWILLTSGTTGAPKLVLHTLESLTAAMRGSPAAGDAVVWGTFYDIRRYGGMQILLRALLGGASVVLTSPGDTVAEYLDRLARHRVTHLSGTPTHWRRVLMTGLARTIAPDYVRLSGEIADQGILEALRGCYPAARIAHAFASTEAGVGFEVNDGLEGFPVATLGTAGDVAIRVTDGSLRIQSTRNAARYLGESDGAIKDDEGFVDTGDVVERRGDRYFFLGRRNGLINVGGAKVYPEEVEAVINRHPAVRMCRVFARPSPIVGSLVVAEVVLAEGPDGEGARSDPDSCRREILGMCREVLAAHKVPATMRFVPALNVATGGKLLRSHA